MFDNITNGTLFLGFFPYAKYKLAIRRSCSSYFVIETKDSLNGGFHLATPATEKNGRMLPQFQPPIKCSTIRPVDKTRSMVDDSFTQFLASRNHWSPVAIVLIVNYPLLHYCFLQNYFHQPSIFTHSLARSATQFKKSFGSLF
jgi:hypothetical protein